jgi:MFS superfamily sulfate permease-like transporter
LNAIALTVLIGQLPKVFGFSVTGDGLLNKSTQLVQGVLGGKTNLTALAIGASCLALILLVARYRPRLPGILIAVVLATVVSAFFQLADTAQLKVVGSLPQGLPSWQFPVVSWQDVVQLLPGAVIISILSFADTSVLSRALAQRGNYQVNQNQEMVALGVANIATGLFQGFSVSSSASRTPVAESAGAKTQLTGVVGALGHCLAAALCPWPAERLAQRRAGRCGHRRLPVVCRHCRHARDVPPAQSRICAVAGQLHRRGHAGGD